MTLQEKRVILNRYCFSVDDCDNCKLAIGGWSVEDDEYHCPVIANSPENDLDRAIAIINCESAVTSDARPDYWGEVCKIQKRQTEKGLEKYGQRLEDNHDLTMTERLEYLEEELIDGLMYIEHIKAAFRDAGVFMSLEDLRKTRDRLDKMIRDAEEDLV